MQIVVNHLTRMAPPRICIAGIDLETDRHVRPITPPWDPLTRDHLAEYGGPFRIGEIVDLGDARAMPNPPETEDHGFRTDAASSTGRLSADEYLELVARVSEQELVSIFGLHLERRGRTFAIEEGHGSVSLGVLEPRDQPRLRTDAFGSLRLTLDEADVPPRLPVTDIRFFEDDQKTVRPGAVDDAAARIRRGVPVLLMVGLSRPWQKEDDDRPRHWLQVNGVCMKDRPLGDLP
jgi:putative nucleic acid modification protein with dual OB domain